VGIIATVEVQAALWVCLLGAGENTIWVFFYYCWAVFTFLKRWVLSSIINPTLQKCEHCPAVGFILTWIECPFLSIELLRHLKTGFKLLTGTKRFFINTKFPDLSRQSNLV
jgi:hypothetical protein